MARRIVLKPIREFFSENPELSEIFVELHKFVMDLSPAVYFETTKSALLYFAQDSVRNFVHITQKRGKIVLWTGGKELPGIEPIQKHPAWGSVNVKTNDQLPTLKAALSMSFEHFLFTVAAGQPVAWDAPIPKFKKKEKGDF